MNYAFVAIIDILGYRDGLKADQTSKTTDYQGKLRDALNKSLVDIPLGTYNYEANCDTIIIACHDMEAFVDFLKIVKNVSIEFIRKGIFVRGGIAYNLHLREHYFTYSYAMVSAHLLEKNVAIYPRIVIENNLIKMFDSNNNIVMYNRLVESNLVVEENGIHFLNILDKSNWDEMYQFAETMYKDYDQKFPIPNDLDDKK